MSESEHLGIAARRRMTAGICLLVLFLCVGGSVLYFRFLAAAPPRNPPMRVVAAAPAKVNPTLDEQRLERTRLLRGKLRVWAWDHRADLKRMLRGDQAGLMTVWKKVHTSLDYPRGKGIQWEDLYPGGDPMINPALGFSWWPTGHETDAPTLVNSWPGSEKGGTRSVLRGRMPRNFETHRDIVIAQSPGEPNATLWASGRITMWTYAPREQTIRDEWAGTHRPVEPPYDFLQ